MGGHSGRSGGLAGKVPERMSEYTADIMMQIYIYICIICINVYMYICIYVFMYICTYVYMYICMYLYIYVNMYICINIYVYMYVII